MSAIRSNELSTLRYREGFSDYQRVLDSQQRLFTEQQRYISNQGNTLRSLVAIYLALGLGWEQREGLPQVDDELRRYLWEAADSVEEEKKRLACTRREAAYAVALKRIGTVFDQRGIWP